jgi:hypothetical protein
VRKTVGRKISRKKWKFLVAGGFQLMSLWYRDLRCERKESK